MTAFNDNHFDDALFAAEPTTAGVTLADRFGVPPFSVLDRRGGEWQERKRRWLSLGIKSEVGRNDGLTFQNCSNPDFAEKFNKIGGTSVFDPVLCELVYRWFSRPGAHILDPFCGGSVRGVVAGALERRYTGIDIRPEQVDANREQVDLAGGMDPTWLVGDATNLHATVGAGSRFDMVFSCPPYADLEVYSDDPRDLSTWEYPDFVEGHAKAITDACGLLRDNRYAAWVIGDVRDHHGRFRGLHHATVDAFRAAGLHVVNEFVTVDPVGSAAIRAPRPFTANRKATTAHQHLLVFVKGDIKMAAQWAAS